jgi:pimeloyl-ACP methyl ester carboxylesterase
MPTITIDDQSLYYTRKRGPAGAPALFLIHPAGGTHLDWPPQLRRLPQAAVYAIDLPGHGRSAPPGRRRIADYAGDVAKTVDTLQLDNVVLAGHSMGGAISQEIAIGQPSWLRGLVLIGTGACLPVNSSLLEQTTAYFPAAVDFMVRYSWSRQAPEELVAAGQAQLVKTHPEVLSGDLHACNEFDRRGDLGAIAVPTLVIAGTADRMMPPAFSVYLAATIPHARLLQLEGAGHMMMLEQPATVAAAIGDFITRLTVENT